MTSPRKKHPGDQHSADPWNSLLTKADPATTAAHTPHALGSLIRQRVRRQQQRRMIAASLFIPIFIGGLATLLVESGTPTQPGTPQLAGSQQEQSTRFKKQAELIAFEVEALELIEQAKHIGLIAEAFKQSMQIERATKPSAISIEQIEPDAAEIADLMLRLTERGANTWLSPEQANKRYTQILDLFPGTPAAKTAQQKLNSSESTAPFNKDLHHA